MIVGSSMLRLLPRSRSFVCHIVVLLLTFRCPPAARWVAGAGAATLPQVHFNVNYSIIRN